MRKIIIYAIAAFLTVSSQALAQPDDSEQSESQTQEEESSFVIGAESDFNSRYLWHGFAWTDGAVLQPSVWISAFDLTFSIWGNSVLNDEPNHLQFNEWDFTIGYEVSWMDVSFEPSFEYYIYPNQADSPATGMLILMVSYPVESVSLYTCHSFDLVEYTGAYFGEVGFSYMYEFSGDLSLESSVGIGWASDKFNETYDTISKGTLSTANLSIASTWYPAGGIYLRPHIEFSTLLNGDLRFSTDDEDLINGGLAVGFEY